MHEPSWWRDGAPQHWAHALAPVAAVYAAVARRRLSRCPPAAAALPVICIGNFTAGGAGKTPLAIAVARLLAAHGLRPAFLTRGYGGRERGPHWVDAERDGARIVGDEPLLLARAFSTLVCRDRPRGAAVIAETGRHDVVVMDDGLQNLSLPKTFAIAVVDGGRGLGNGRVLPAGPLRAALVDQLSLVDAIVLNRGVTGDGEALRGTLRGLGKPLFESRLVVGPQCPDLAGRRVVAWTGIADPGRFMRTLAALGADLVAAEALGDHRLPSEATATRLLELAAREQASIVTTEKDLLRLVGEPGVLDRLRKRTRSIPVSMTLADRDRERLVTMLETAVRLGGRARPDAALMEFSEHGATRAEASLRTGPSPRETSPEAGIDEPTTVDIRGARPAKRVTRNPHVMGKPPSMP